MADIEMIPVSSQQIESAGYDADTQQLRIRFVGKGNWAGALYEYDGVDKSIFDALINAPSAGQYLAAAIKGVYPYRRLE